MENGDSMKFSLHLDFNQIDFTNINYMAFIFRILDENR
jgi:hypothetical protein